LTDGPAPCPICGKPASPDAKTRPFCSPRCKMVDLGRWFTEAYRVPGEDAVSFEGLGGLDSPESLLEQDPERDEDANG
jgi:endogenous inhibitor of DNA gyrase (YacG/DUF329 family)